MHGLQNTCEHGVITGSTGIVMQIEHVRSSTLSGLRGTGGAWDTAVLEVIVNNI